MKIDVKYFGVIAEQTGISDEQLDLSVTGQTLAELKNYCENQYSALSASSYQLSVNRKLVSDVTLKDGDEIAFLPPFAGG